MTERLAVVLAHPDDDTYGVGGTAALHAGPDLEVTIVLTTSGEAGRIYEASLATRASLGAVREAEDRASWAELGVRPSFHFLRHPDSSLANVPREQLVAEIAEILLAARPDVVVTFGPDGVTGHEDHVAVGAATEEAFHLARETAGAGLQRLLFVGVQQSRIDRFNGWLVGHGSEPIDPAEPFAPRGLPDDRFGIVVDCGAVYDRKLEALRQHRTQGELEDLPYELWPEILGVEAFVFGWPERVADDPILSDVFEGLRDS